MVVRNFDETLELVGQHGRYQAFIMLLTGLAFLVVGAQNMSAVFTAGIPEYKCSSPSDDVTVEFNVTSSGNLSLEESEDLNKEEENCEVNINGSEVKCNEWIYSSDVYETSIVTEVRSKITLRCVT